MAADEMEDDVVSGTVTVDAQELFSQLSTSAYLGKRESSRGHLTTIQGLTDGTIRVWRTWLAKHCQSRTWTDHNTVPVVTDSSKGKSRAGSVSSIEDPTKDPNILWVNTRDDNVGIKFKVRERKWRRNNPILFASDEEVAVSYLVEFEGKLLCSRFPEALFDL